MNKHLVHNICSALRWTRHPESHPLVARNGISNAGGCHEKIPARKRCSCRIDCRWFGECRGSAGSCRSSAGLELDRRLYRRARRRSGGPDGFFRSLRVPDLRRLRQNSRFSCRWTDRIQLASTRFVMGVRDRGRRRRDNVQRHQHLLRGLDPLPVLGLPRPSKRNRHVDGAHRSGARRGRSYARLCEGRPRVGSQQSRHHGGRQCRH